MDNPSTLLDIDLDLWLKAWFSCEPDTNQVYELSNTTIKNLWTTRTVSTVGCPQLIPNVQTLEFTGMLDQQVYD
jgi:outer membrane protein assembly factor BamB